ncbi:hypothetical protein PAPYR_13450 [Paratrimastix pyriformis]|uniref:Uncharacterized protein n=1 Tax=Paratrimastix pyriformis TaxID=342808 RepID=A0ABQ8U0A2_9EUKA|nr:hypothetical protein PAPYR_13450 [Paratrimastix pyriformis]
MLVTDDMLAQCSPTSASRASREAGLPRPLGPCLVRTGGAPHDRPARPPRCSFIWVVLWELITRQTPWDGVPPLRVMMTVAREDGRLRSRQPPASAHSAISRQCFEADPREGLHAVGCAPDLSPVGRLCSAECERHPYVDAALVAPRKATTTGAAGGGSKKRRAKGGTGLRGRCALTNVSTGSSFLDLSSSSMASEPLLTEIIGQAPECVRSIWVVVTITLSVSEHPGIKPFVS